MANRISTLIDFDTKGGVKSLGALKNEIKNTDGAFGKLKVAGAGAMDQIKANAAAFSVAAGASLVAFGVKAVGSFTDAAIAAGNFADSTGLSREEASQWISVADDYGLSADTLQKSFLKMNKEIGEGGGLVDEYGLALVRTKDGTADVNATMLAAIKTIGEIEDPTKRAAAAQEVFGRSYAEVAEIVLGDSDKIVAALESTSDAQIFDDDEVQKARDYRAAMDKLNDVFTDITMIVGEQLTPALSESVDELAGLLATAEKLKILELGGEFREWFTFNPKEQFDKIRESSDKMLWSLDAFTGTAEEAREELEALGASEEDISEILAEMTKRQEEANAETAKAAEEARASADAEAERAAAVRDARHEQALANTELKTLNERYDNLGPAVEDVIESTDELTQSTSELLDEINQVNGSVFDYEKATLTLADSIGNLADKTGNELREAQIGAAEDALAAAQAFADQKYQGDNAALSATYQRTELQALQEKYPELRAEIQLYIDELNRIPANINTRLSVSGGGLNNSVNVGGKRAAGGPVSAGVPYLVGERGPEIVVPAGNGTVIPNNKLSAGGGSSYTINVNGFVNEQSIQQLTSAIREIERRGRGAA